MKIPLVFTVMSLALTACAQVPVLDRLSRAPEPIATNVTETETDPTALVRPVLRPDRSTPSAVQQSGTLGTTIVSLGTPTEPGLWLKTPLVTAERQGQVVTNGQSVSLVLKPIDGPATAGSRMSLEAMQALGLPLTDLSEVTVRLE